MHLNEALSNLKSFTVILLLSNINIIFYQAKTHLQEAAITCIVSQLSTADHQNLIQAFKKFDKNGNGTISKQELLDGYKELYGDRLDIEAEVEDIWNKIDMDGSGTIDYTEWAVGTINKANIITK